jgi:hypothetical protein
VTEDNLMEREHVMSLDQLIGHTYEVAENQLK